MSFDPDYGVYRSDPRDPRTPDEPDRYSWEEDNPVADWMDSSDLECLLSELLHGDSAKAKGQLENAVQARFEQWIDDQARQDAEDAARDRYEDRRAA